MVNLKIIFSAVGWEGTFGFLTLSTLLIPMYFIPVSERFGDNPRHVLEDAYDGLVSSSFSSTPFSVLKVVKDV
jgi:hypothetical protein